MRFDWYSATVPAGPDDVLGAMLSAWDLSSVKEIRPKHGYERGAQIHRGDRVLATAWWGGPNGSDVHAWASGSDCPAFADLVRSEWPEHRVSRADVCEDYTAPGAWDVLSGMAITVADEYRLKLDTRGDWVRNAPGRTLYLGSRKSVATCRVYEKGVQMAAEGLPGADTDWVRVELEVKPQKRPAKLLAARMLPVEFWGASRWSLGLVEMLGAEHVQRIKLGTVYEAADVDRARAALVRQYGKHLIAWAESLGDEGPLISEIRRMFESTLKHTAG